MNSNKDRSETPKNIITKRLDILNHLTENQIPLKRKDHTIDLVINKFFDTSKLDQNGKSIHNFNQIYFFKSF